MAKVIKHILALTIIFVTLIVIGIIYSINNTAQAEEHPVFPDGVMTTQQIPIFCGSGPVVFSYATSLFKQKSVAYSEVKRSGNPNSKSFAWISFWYSEELNNGSIFLTIKETGETCMMGYGMEWIFDTEILLDIVNNTLNDEGDL